MSTTISTATIETAIDQLVADVSTSFSFVDTSSDKQILSVSIQRPIRYSLGFVQIQWQLSSSQNNTVIRECGQKLLPLANVNSDDGSFYITLKNKANTDIALDAVYLLMHDTNGAEIESVISTQIGQTSQQVQELNHLNNTSQIEASLILDALQKIQADRDAYLRQISSSSSSSSSDSSSTNTTTSPISSSNFINWRTEGQQVFESDGVHKQLWKFIQLWNEYFELIMFTEDENNTVVDPVAWIMWDVQNIYFSDSYEQLYNNIDQAFATSLFPVVNDNSSLIVHTWMTNQYTTISNPNVFQLMIHFQRKKDTAGGFLVHRCSVESEESDSVINSIFGENQQLLNTMYSQFGEILWSIRSKQHISD